MAGYLAVDDFSRRRCDQEGESPASQRVQRSQGRRVEN
jgi:hypothetical protein